MTKEGEPCSKGRKGEGRKGDGRISPYQSTFASGAHDQKIGLQN